MKTLSTIFWIAIMASYLAMYGFFFLPWYVSLNMPHWLSVAGVVGTVILVAAFILITLFRVFVDWIEHVEDQLEEPLYHSPKSN